MRTLLSILDVFGVLLMGVLLSVSSKGLQSNSNSNDSTIKLGGYEFSFSFTFSIRELAILTVAIFILKSFLASLFLYKFTSALADSEIKVTQRATSAILNSNYADVSKISKSDLNFALTYASSFASTSILTLFVTIVSEGFMLLGIGIIFFVINPSVTFGTIAYFFAIGYVIQKIVGKYFQSNGRIYSDSASKSTQVIDDSLSAFKDIKVLSRTTAFTNKFMKPRADLAKANSILTFLGAMPRYIIESSLMIGALLLASVSFASGDIEKATSTIGIFLTGGFRIMASMLPLQNALGAINLNAAQATKFFEALNLLKIDLRSIKEETDTSLKKSHSPVGIKLENISYAYAEADTAVSNINLNIEAGSTTAIIGPSGSGKSTLADLILGILVPQSGKISFLDETGNPSDRQGITFGYVPQSPGIIKGTILENIALGVPLENVDMARIEEVTRLANLEGVISSLENGIDTDLGAQTDALSGGQMQRIGLARALYDKPGLLILDEATSSLDAESEFAITNSIQNIGSAMTVIVIAHRLSTVQNSDQVYVLESGQITGNGTFTDLMSKNSLVAKYVKIMNIETS